MTKDLAIATQNFQNSYDALMTMINNYNSQNNFQDNSKNVVSAQQKIPNTLDVSLYGNIEPINDVLSKCRVRIFYTGLNRNRTYISENFAQQLIDSLPYTPIKGIFCKDEVDYGDHGEDNTDGKIYGIVMENPNFAWEDHLDIDGETRTYACADVLLFTGLYPEAKIIPGSSQSMEIFRNTLKGEWRIWEADGKPYYYFEKGCLLGLQVLGTETEPCFEGAAFFTLYSDLKEIMNHIKIFNEKEEKAEMNRTLFRLSDSEKAEAIAQALNPNFNEEGNWEISCIILDVYDDYAVVRNYSTKGYQRVYYTKDGDNITINKIEDCFIVDITATEQAALEAIKAASGTYESAQATLEEQKAIIEQFNNQLEVKSNETLSESINAPTEQFSKEEFETKIIEKEQELETIKANYNILENEKIELEKTIADLNTEKEELLSFKKTVETEKKMTILDKYMEHLSDSTIDNFKASIENYSVEDFKKEICTAVVETAPSIFSKSDEPRYFFKGGTTGENENKGLTGMERLLENYKNGGNK